MTFKYRYRKQIIISIIILLLIGGIISYFYFSKDQKKDKKPKNILVEKKNLPKEKEEKKEEPKEIMVDVKGEVNNSGIYNLKEGSRVIDAINMAGGITANGDTSVLNLSKKVTDEMVIIVYSYYEVKNFEQIKERENVVTENCINGVNGLNNDACITNNETNTEENKKVSINTATLEELMTLSGIGEAKAKSIIEYREEFGEFKNIEDLKNVSGIGEALFDKIKENITL